LQIIIESIIGPELKLWLINYYVAPRALLLMFV